MLTPDDAPAPQSIQHLQVAVRDAVAEKKDRFLRRAEVLRLLGVSSATMYAWINEGKFCAPIRLSARCSVWSEAQVQAFIQSKIASANPLGLTTAESREPGHV